MNRKFRKTVTYGLAAALMAGTFAGVGTTARVSTEEAGTLEVEVIYTGDQLELFRGIMDDFTAQTGIGIDLITPGADYEEVMKTRMASGEMPDVFVTHGWSIARYKEYLTALNDQEWFGRIDESIMPIISDDEENIYVLPLTQGANGFVYNKKVLENAGVKAGDIRTMDDFKEACEAVKESGVTPIHIGGKDTWTAAVFYNAMAPAFYTVEGCKYPSGDALKDGSFDWDTDGRYVLEEIASMVESGYFNSDFVTADNAATITALGEGTCAFGTGGVEDVLKAKNISPDAELGVIPIPATTEEGKSEYMIGEGSCFGIWKDTEYMDEAKQFLAYLAEPETAVKVMQVDGSMPAMEGMEIEENIVYKAFAESQAAFDGDIFYDNLFDREYFPSGMFNVMADAVIEVFMDPSEAGVDAGVEQLKTNYQDKL